VIQDVLTESLRAALSTVRVDAPETIGLDRPARREHGDWSSNVAMATAKASGRNPRELAQAIVDVLAANPPQHVEKVEVAGPGFVNFHLRDSWLHDVLAEVAARGEQEYGRLAFGSGERVQIEFVSANPTGPVHVGNGWFGSYGDALARLMLRCGYDVSREYYVNDTGGQIRRLGGSVLARRAGRAVSDEGYPSGFVKGLASAYDGPDDEVAAGEWAAARVIAFIRHQMEAVHIVFDEWFSQASIEESDAVADAIQLLRDKGHVFERDGAVWLRTADFGDPREERVLQRSPDKGGTYTYLAGDIAYHYNKFVVRGFDRVINVWGADHEAQVASLVAAMEQLGVARGRLEVQIGQMISLASGRMSKREGNAVDLDDLVNDIGADAFRLLSLTASINQAPTIDIDKVRADSKDSPVFYVQYAHARIASIGRFAAERGIERLPVGEADLSLLTHERELDILRALAELPEVVESACRLRAPHRVAGWVRDLADRFHGFYHDCYVIGDEVSGDLTQARLWLVEVTRMGLAIGLDLLGVAAPDSM
jgi:arginyl-tRNA synthetase